MYLLYPRLPRPVAEAAAAARASISPDELVEMSSLNHDLVQFAPTGGNKINPNQLGELQRRVRECAAQYGYPHTLSDDLARQFDVKCAVMLHQNMHLHPSEASHIEMWAFMGCILIPDVVRWRFFGDRTAKERFIGEDRGLRRHAFGRLWWRAYLLHQPKWTKPYDLLNYLYEDDLVQITERNSIAALPVLARAFSLSFLRAAAKYNAIPRRMLIREASKRLFRLLSIISFEVLDDQTVQTITDDVFEKTAITLGSVEKTTA